MTQMWVLRNAGTSSEQLVPIDGRLHIGCECAGVEESRRLLVDDLSVSRDHAEIRADGDSAVLIDSSTNGTRLNGRRIEGGERVPLRDGDRITVGECELLFCVVASEDRPTQSMSTVNAQHVAETVVLVGDLISYTRLTETNGPTAVGEATDSLFGPLRALVIAHGGVVNNYAGDAMLAVWEFVDTTTCIDVVRCALAAAQTVSEMAPRLTLRDHEGQPLQMGWAVTKGPVAFSHPSPRRASLHGDAINLAFRVSGLAGRAGHASVLVSDDVATDAADAATFGDLQTIAVKGRVAPAEVRAITAARTRT